MTPPEREAAYALDHGVSPEEAENLQPAVKAEYLRQLEIRRTQGDVGWECPKCGQWNGANAGTCTRIDDKGVRQCSELVPVGALIQRAAAEGTNTGTAGLSPPADAGLRRSAPSANRFPATMEARRRILEALADGSRKYAKPFDRGTMAGFSVIGTESWSEYGSVVLQMATLDTLMSIEEKLTELLAALGDTRPGDAN
jgi:hypothetical protein